MKVGIIGAGTMGSGIAQAFAQVDGYEVCLCDINEEFASNGKLKISKNFEKRVAKGKMAKEDADKILARIHTGVKTICSDCDLVVEAAIENMEIKKQTFKELGAICKADLNTPAEIVDKVKKISEEIGKIPVQVEEGAGFVVNRILIPMINEAIGIYAEGEASVEGIDTAMKLGANHPMGPLELGDLVGLDVVLAIMEVLQSETGDPLLRKMVRGGKLGRKSGEGFYKYN